MKIIKKNISVALILLLLAGISVLFSGCGEKTAKISSVLKIDENFSGSRSISIEFPTEMYGESLEKALRDSMPEFNEDSGAYSLSEPVLTGTGNKEYTFNINFSSKEDYENKISAIIGREASVSAAYPNNILAKGIRLTEDFSIQELAFWITNAVSEAGLGDKLNYEYPSNIINISGDVYTADEEINIKELEGYPVEAIKIETGNTKDGKYERRFTFTVSNTVYEQLGDNLRNYFNGLTDERADFNGWSLQGANQEYMVIYQGLDISGLNEVTNKMLGTEDCKVFYGDKTNASTPLSEGLDFEEELSLFNFFSGDGEAVPLTYTYTLPTETTHGDGQIYKRGQWEVAGDWNGSTFSYSGDGNALRLNISDGIQYRIEGINYTTKNIGDSTFCKTIDFLYSSTAGQKAQSYAYNYFAERGADVTKLNIGDYIACRVTVEGSPLEISVKTVDLFGAGNYTDYNFETPAYSLTNNSTFKDYINISALLNAQNSSVPMSYTVIPGSGESLRELTGDSPNGNQSTAKPDDSGNFTLTFTGGQVEVTYYGASANSQAVRNYIIFSVILFAVVIAIVSLLWYRGTKTAAAKKANDVSYGQTTYFSLRDIRKRSSKRNKSDRQGDAYDEQALIDNALLEKVEKEENNG